MTKKRTMLLLTLALAVNPQAIAQRPAGEVWSTVIEGKDFWPYESSRKRAIKYCKSYDFTPKHRDVRKLAKLHNSEALKAEALSIVPVEKTSGHWTAHYVGRVWLRKKGAGGDAANSRTCFERSIRREVLREMLRQTSPDKTATWAALASGLGGSRTRGFLKGLRPSTYASSYRQMLITVRRANEILGDNAKSTQEVTSRRIDQLLADIEDAKSNAWSNYWRSGAAATLPTPPAFARSSTPGTITDSDGEDSLLIAGASIAWRKTESPSGIASRFGMKSTGSRRDCIIQLKIQTKQARAAKVDIAITWKHPHKEKLFTTNVEANAAHGSELIIRASPPSADLRATAVAVRRSH